MKIYIISDKECNIFYRPEISCTDAHQSLIPYIFDKEPYYLGDKLYESTWLDNCLEYAQDEFPEVEWQIIEVKVEKIGELNENRRRDTLR